MFQNDCTVIHYQEFDRHFANLITLELQTNCSIHYRKFLLAQDGVSFYIKSRDIKW